MPLGCNTAEKCDFICEKMVNALGMTFEANALNTLRNAGQRRRRVLATNFYLEYVQEDGYKAISVDNTQGFDTEFTNGVYLE